MTRLLELVEAHLGECCGCCGEETRKELAVFVCASEGHKWDEYGWCERSCGDRSGPVAASVIAEREKPYVNTWGPVTIPNLER